MSEKTEFFITQSLQQLYINEREPLNTGGAEEQRLNIRI